MASVILNRNPYRNIGYDYSRVEDRIITFNTDDAIFTSSGTTMTSTTEITPYSLFMDLEAVKYYFKQIPLLAAVRQWADNAALLPMAALWFTSKYRTEGVSLKDVCKAWGVPWHAKDVLCNSKDMLEIARCLTPSQFGQWCPKTAEDQEKWATRVHPFLTMDICPWVAVHCLELDHVGMASLVGWMMVHKPKPALSLKVATVLEEKRRWEDAVAKKKREEEERQRKTDLLFSTILGLPQTYDLVPLPNGSKARAHLLRRDLNQHRQATTPKPNQRKTFNRP